MEQRPIKFRALVEYEDKRVWEYYTTFSQPAWLDSGRVIVKDLQYTGLKDKNGKEIYLGDILRVLIEEGQEENSCNFGIVKWIKDEARFYANLGQFIPNEIAEVIGNIYENPELKQKAR